MAAVACFVALLVSVASASGQSPGDGLPRLSVLDVSTTGSGSSVLYERVDWGDLRFDLVLGICDGDVCAPKHVLIADGFASFDDVERSKGSLEQTSDATRAVYLDDGAITIASCDSAACGTIEVRTAPAPPGTEVFGLATTATGPGQFRLFIASSGGLFVSSCTDSSCGSPERIGTSEGVWGLDVVVNGDAASIVTVTDDGADVVVTTCGSAEPISSCGIHRVEIEAPRPLPLEATSHIEVLDSGRPVILTRTGRGESVIVRCLQDDCSSSRVLDVPDGVFLSALAPPRNGDVLGFGSMPGGGVRAVRCGDTSCFKSSYPVLAEGPRSRIDVSRVANGDIVIAMEAAGAAAPVLVRCDPICDAGSSASPLSIGFQGLDGREGLVARLYAAYFQRDPDLGGYAFWLDAIDQGVWTNARASDHFAASAEFRQTYGSAVSDSEFLAIAYANVFDRAPDTGGRQFWLDQMAQGLSRGEVVLYFSDSSEFRERSRTR
ncbi:MAG: DUF4214 domain-containing protein [Acidimicrobiales bacterium]